MICPEKQYRNKIVERPISVIRRLMGFILFLERSRDRVILWTSCIRKKANIRGLSSLKALAESIFPRTSSENARDIPEEGDGLPVIFS